jgi:GNAT superfamily N-acetyltransferase
MQEEPLGDEFFKEAGELLQAHWEECAGWKDTIPLAPDTIRYKGLHQLGYARVFILRAEGAMVGYISVLTTPNLHYKDHVFAIVDTVFIHPDYRKGPTGLMFMRWVEGEMREYGAAIMSYHIKVAHDYPALFKRLGYAPTEIIYAKDIRKQRSA